MLLNVKYRFLEGELEDFLDGGLAGQRKGDVIVNGAVLGVELEAAAVQIL